MKVSASISSLIGFVAALSSPAAEPFDHAAAEAAVRYRERAKAAAENLVALRERIGAEKAPWIARQREAENRILAAESEASRLETAQEKAGELRRKSMRDLDALRKSTSYINTLAREGLKAFTDALAPGEALAITTALESVQAGIDDPATGQATGPALAVADLLLAQTERRLGGYSVPGRAMLAEGNDVVAGTYAFVGPEGFFFASSQGLAGTVRSRSGTPYPVCHTLSGWKPKDATRFFVGQPAPVPLDATEGKALRLQETTGTLVAHVRKGGLVAYAIIGVGLLSFVLVLGKIRDLAGMRMDSPETVLGFLRSVAAGDRPAAHAALGQLRTTTKDLFQAGLQHLRGPKSVLEENLQALLLRQRLGAERRLPLLAVIATAAPLMGLLGTVTGMVKTFALITVFGTGNAGRLSSGISEVLVATELGLIVAIPTLVAHGFLSHRIQKNLSTLERYALQFVTAADSARARPTTAAAATPRPDEALA